ncbi:MULTISPECIES: hypothetical protein [unclassified Streptomyces]|uniref:hypothetical protein n=1 Tax=unclassified Streptomyces TaxID=2593676 RepID=UPI0022576B53|nr:hypothetical protein [Streptomyces sp. NBC_00320]MCX5146206.1 hypothetical protein [Streptomyces sp. NBC_00320]WSW61170.1 hypothetical protein OG513_22790 [Streptomyces sp. NBC_00998]
MFLPRSPRPVLTASAAVLALLLTGCSQSDGGDSDKEPAIGEVPTLLESRNLTFPIASYMPDARQLAVLDEAQDVLTDQCMQRYGFRYQLRRKAGPVTRDYNRRYGLSDPAEAARYGYDNPQLVRTERPPQPVLGPNEELVLHGLQVDPSLPVPMSQEEAEKSDVATTVVGGQKVPAGGCGREAALKLLAPTKDTVDYMFVQGFSTDSYARSRKDSRVVKAFKSWSACMKERGYTVDNPMDPPPGINDSNRNSPQAISTAKQDIDCKKQTNLVGTWYTVETAYQKRLIEQNAETLDRAKRQLDERMKLAASLIAGS